VYVLWRLPNVFDNAFVRAALCSDLSAISPVLEDGGTFSLVFQHTDFFVFYCSTC